MLLTDELKQLEQKERVPVRLESWISCKIFSSNDSIRLWSQQTAKTRGKQECVTATYTGLDYKVYPAPCWARAVSCLPSRCWGHPSPLRRRGRTRANHAFDNSENQLLLHTYPTPLPVTAGYTVLYIHPSSVTCHSLPRPHLSSSYKNG